MTYGITRWKNPLIFHWHLTTVGEACNALGKTDSLDSAHCMPKLSIPWNVIWACFWKWECITEWSRWPECMPKTREERNRSIKKGCLRTYCSLVRLGSVCFPDMTSPASVLWQAMRGVEQGAGDRGKRSGGGRRGTNRSQRPRIKSDTRTREKDQVSKVGAERLNFQES